jgi:hypothetical protein
MRHRIGATIAQQDKNAIGNPTNAITGNKLRPNSGKKTAEMTAQPIIAEALTARRQSRREYARSLPILIL